MRPLHRPLDDRFVFAEDWDKLSDEQKIEYEARGKLRLPSRTEYKNFKKEDYEKWKPIMKPFFDDLKIKMGQMFRDIPTSLLLVCRLFKQPLFFL
jgi:hypothetical protein